MKNNLYLLSKSGFAVVFALLMVAGGSLLWAGLEWQRAHETCIWSDPYFNNLDFRLTFTHLSFGESDYSCHPKHAHTIEYSQPNEKHNQERFIINPNTTHLAVALRIGPDASEMIIRASISTPDNKIYGPLIGAWDFCQLEETTCRWPWDQGWSVMILEDPVPGEYQMDVEAVQGWSRDGWYRGFSVFLIELQVGPGSHHPLLEADSAMWYGPDGSQFVLFGGHVHPLEGYRRVAALSTLTVIAAATAVALLRSYATGPRIWGIAWKRFTDYRWNRNHLLFSIILAGLHVLATVLAFSNATSLAVEGFMTGESTSGDQGKILIAIAVAVGLAWHRLLVALERRVIARFMAGFTAFWTLFLWPITGAVGTYPGLIAMAMLAWTPRTQEPAAPTVLLSELPSGSPLPTLPVHTRHKIHPKKIGIESETPSRSTSSTASSSPKPVAWRTSTKLLGPMAGTGRMDALGEPPPGNGPSTPRRATKRDPRPESRRNPFRRIHDQENGHTHRPKRGRFTANMSTRRLCHVRGGEKATPLIRTGLDTFFVSILNRFPCRRPPHRPPCKRRRDMGGWPQCTASARTRTPLHFDSGSAAAGRARLHSTVVHVPEPDTHGAEPRGIELGGPDPRTRTLTHTPRFSASGSH